MIGLALLVRRELGLALHGGTDAMITVVFFVLAAVLFPFGIGADPGGVDRLVSGPWTRITGGIRHE